MTQFEVTLAALISLGACACDRIEGSGRAIEDARTLPPFDRVEVSAGLEAEVSIGSRVVILRGDDNILPSIVTTVHDGLLTIEPLHDLDPTVPLSIQVSAPSLGSAALRAGGRLWVNDIAVERFELIGEAGGEIVASGAVDHLTVELTAGGEIDARELVSPSVSIFGSAGGTMSVTATEEISGAIESGSVARIHGAPASRSVQTRSGGEVFFED